MELVKILVLHGIVLQKKSKIETKPKMASHSQALTEYSVKYILPYTLIKHQTNTFFSLLNS